MEISSKWQQNVNGETKIKVYWENPSISNQQERLWVQEAIEKTWEKHANIDFVGWTGNEENANGIRILIDNYSHPHCKGLGNKLMGKPNGMVLNFQFLGKFKCWNTRKECIEWIAVHEFGHALGIAHEQNRSDCGCEEHPGHYGGGGFYVTPCDTFSVMNYCNPNWNNNGQLSKYDISGIQAVYGKRQFKEERIDDSMISSISNTLGNNQVWENLLFQIEGSEFIFNINSNNPVEVKSVSFSSSGVYNYSISSQSLHTDGTLHYGYGRGSLYFEANKSYRLKFVADNFSNEHMTIQLVAEDVNGIKIKLNDNNPGMGRKSNFHRDLIRNGKKPSYQIILNNIKNEKFYVYSDGAIVVYNLSNGKVFKFTNKKAPYYQNWNGITWAWSFERPIGNNLVERYTVSTAGEIWGVSTDNTFVKFGIVTNIDF